MDQSQKYPNEEYPLKEETKYHTLYCLTCQAKHTLPIIDGKLECPGCNAIYYDAERISGEYKSLICPACSFSHNYYPYPTICCSTCGYKAKIENFKLKEEPQYRPITTEALNLVNGDKRKDYGDVKTSFENIAKDWSLELAGKLKEPITSHEVARMMIRFKLVRERNMSKRDNRVDICGYAELLNMLYES